MRQLNSDYFVTAVDVMRGRNIDFAPGLTAQQIDAAESAHAFSFPPDLRAFLEYALPIDGRFPDWRDPTSEFIQDRLSWPADSMCFDLEHNSFWLPSWGKKPDTLEAAQTRARTAVRAAPLLIPIYAHRYLPATPCEACNPVFSVYQTDIIFYGLDLPSYLFAEFGVPNPFPVPETPREIEFWCEMVRLNDKRVAT